MPARLPALALTGLLALGACTDGYGNVDPVATGLLGAGVGVATGLAIASASQPRHVYVAPRHGYRRPVHHYHHHYHRGPRYGWGPRHRYW